MKIGLGKVVGRLGEGEWGVVHEFSPSDPEKVARWGRLVAIVSLKVEAGGEDQMVAETGREVMVRLNELYYGGEQEEIVGRLRAALEGVTGEFGEAGVVCLVFVGGVVYLGAAGGAGVWVRKDEREGWLVRPETRQVTTMSGRVIDGQVLVAGNQSFWNRLTEGVLKAAISNLKGGGRAGMEAAVEMLAAVEHGGGEEGGGVGVIAEVVEAHGEEAGIGANEDQRAKRGQVLGEDEEVKVEGIQTAGGGRKWVERLWERLGEVRGRWGAKPRVFVINRDESEKRVSGRRTVYAGVAFLVMLAVLFGIGRVQGIRDRERSDLTNRIIEELEQKFREAKALVGINPLRSREILAEVQARVAELDEKSRRDERVMRITADMGEVLGAALGTKRVSVSEVLNLGLVRDGVDAIGVAMGEDDKLWVLDGEGDRLIEVDARRRSGRVAAGRKDLGGGTAGLAFYFGRVLVLSDKGVVECKVNPWGCKVGIGRDGGWKGGDELEIWAGNVYVLDEKGREIWKYTRKEDGYGAGQKWVGEGEGRDLAGAVSMAIDGNIWVAKRNFELVKYIRGVGEGVRLWGWDKGWGERVGLNTSEGTERLYFLDRDNKRVAAAAKTGEYAGQWVGDKIAEAADFAVDEKAEKIYLVGGQHVWEFKM